LLTDGVVLARLMVWSWATEVFSTWPAELVTTTKSPPTTGRPL
jgi:hypothetical protein